MADGPMWGENPTPVQGRWMCFRQMANEADQQEYPALYWQPPDERPEQADGRWHREGVQHAQYLALDPLAAWAEYVKYASIPDADKLREVRRRLWVIGVHETAIADLSTFDKYVACDLDPRLALGPHADSQELSDDLRAAGYRGLLSPSATWPGATNLTLFGTRLARRVVFDLLGYTHLQGTRLPCTHIADAPPVRDAVVELVARDEDSHTGYQEWLANQDGGSD